MARGPEPPQTYAAFCEEFDEDANDVIPDTRRVANIAARRSRPELKPASRSADGASDSGYSSRTAATAGSGGSSLTSGTDHTSLDAHITNRAMDRLQDLVNEEERARPRVKAKDKRDHSDAKALQSTARRASSRPPLLRSASKSRKRGSATGSRNACMCWDCERNRLERAGYQPPTVHPGVDPRSMDPMNYGPHASGHGFEVPPSPQAPRYPPIINQENYPAPPGPPAPRPQRSNSYHTQNRPMSYHGGAVPEVGMSYLHMGHPVAYSQNHGHGPPLSASAYSNTFFASPYMGSEPQMAQPSQSPYDPTYDAPQLMYERSSRRRATSTSRSPDKPTARRPSVYGPPVVQYVKSSKAYYGEPERMPSRERRARRQSQVYDPDEDFYRMPPPPPPQQKPKPPPQVIPIPNQRRPSVRKSTTTPNTPTVDRDMSLEMAEVKAALPRIGRKESRDPVSPERRPSMPPPSRNRVRTTSYHDPARAARVVTESSSRRRRPSVYALEQATEDLEKKQREAEEYQAARTPRLAPLTADSLRKVRRADSDSDSQDSRTDSSRGSDSQTRYGSGVGSTRVEDDSITMIIGGVKIDFPADSVDNRRINVRSGEEGAIELNIEGRRPRRYILTRSDSTSASGRREIEDVRRIRDDNRSDRDSRRSSRSGYSGRGLLE
ncbi:hypothetical protein VTO42DRAFT_1423 [Malbranchea cinnamomea]